MKSITWRHLEHAKCEIVSTWTKGHCSSLFSVLDIIEDLLSVEPKLTDSISLSEMNAVQNLVDSVFFTLAIKVQAVYVVWVNERHNAGNKHIPPEVQSNQLWSFTFGDYVTVKLNFYI